MTNKKNQSKSGAIARKCVLKKQFFLMNTMRSWLWH